MRSIASLLAVIAISYPALVSAQETTAENPAPKPAIRVDLGFGSAVGLFGVVYSRPMASWYGVELGAGAGASGLQLSAMGKLRLGRGDRWKYTPGLGLSLGLPVSGGDGAFHTGHPANDDEAHGSGVLMGWLDVDVVGVEYRSASGLVFAASGGVAVALNHAHWDVVDVGSDINPGDPVPQLRIGMGWTF